MQQITNCNYTLAYYIVPFYINFHLFFVIINGSVVSGKRKIHSIFQVQWSSGNYSFWKRCEQFQTSHSSLSVCLRVACEVVCCKESPFSSSPFLFKQLAQPILPAPVASTFNTNWSLVYDCQIFGMYIYVRGKECLFFF